MKPDLASTWVVVVNWNGGEAANRACLESVLAAGVTPAHLVFVDNASSDGSREAIAREFTEVTKIANAKNEGFGAAANLGARLALEGGAEAVLFLNNDATLEAGCLAALVHALAARPRLGAVGPRVLNMEGDTIWAAGGVLAFGPNLSQLRGNGAADDARFARTVSVDYVPGCALLARREVLEGVGLFDDAYFAYLEDVDLGCRVAAGWEQWCLGEVAARHAGSSATGGGYTARRKYLNALGSWRFLSTHPSVKRWAAFVLCDVLPLPLAFVLALPRGRATGVLAKGLGMWHGLQGRRANASTLEPGGTPLW
ncbi:MAG: glycosyltransferase family 2 protein [Planctomycetota bacterium]|nr:glycosyltransferase family 2 protein [Planctomycetota bacterium]